MLTPQQKSDAAAERLTALIRKIERQGRFSDEAERQTYLKAVDDYLASFVAPLEEPH